jgi:hypothetical protein
MKKRLYKVPTNSGTSPASKALSLNRSDMLPEEYPGNIRRDIDESESRKNQLWAVVAGMLGEDKREYLADQIK